ncbi:MAG: DNA-binding protein [Pseudomonadota bacterium]
MSEYMTVKQTAEAFPAFSESSLRYYIFYAETNNFASCITRIGRKIIIRRDAFIQWVEEQNHAK